MSSAKKIFPISHFEGVDMSTSPYEINDYMSPDMMNVNVENGQLIGRPGYCKAIPEAVSGKVNGMFDYTDLDGTILHMVCIGTKLYKFEYGKALVEIPKLDSYDPILSGNKVVTFNFKDETYLLDGANLFRVNDITYSLVKHWGMYEPTVIMGRGANGGGNAFEAYNLIGTGFKNSFSADGTSKTYLLTEKGLDTSAPNGDPPTSVELNGTFLIENTDYTVDYVNGTVTFVNAPAKGVDNLVITAYKTNANNYNKIAKCTMATIFGGSQDSRALLSGNPDNPAYVYRSGLLDITYFPDNAFQIVGDTNEPISGFTPQYDCMVIHKKHSKYLMTYELQSDGTPLYATRPLNNVNGCIAKDSLQLLDNVPISLDKTGLFELVQSTVRSERNVKLVSSKVNKLLMNELSLENAISVDYNGKYILCVNGNCYIMDYRQLDSNNNPIWYLWNNIRATCFQEIDGNLYFGTADGMIYRFYTHDEENPYNDDGVAIPCYWTSRFLNFGTSFYKKFIAKIVYLMKPFERSQIAFSYNTEEGSSYVGDSGSSGYDEQMDLLDFQNLDFSRTSFITSRYPQPVPFKIKVKKTNFLQLRFDKTAVDEGMGIANIDLKYQLQNEVK